MKRLPRKLKKKAKQFKFNWYNAHKFGFKPEYPDYFDLNNVEFTSRYRLIGEKLNEEQLDSFRNYGII